MKAISVKSHHLPVHSNDVPNERAFLHRCDVSIGNPVDQGYVWAAGDHGARPTVSDQVPISS